MRQYLVLHMLYMLMAFAFAAVLFLVLRRMGSDYIALLVSVGTFNVLFTVMTMGTSILAMRVRE